MAFIDKLSEDLVSAMRAKDTLRLGALRMAKAALMNREIERGRTLDEAESLQVISSLIKQRRDSIEQFQKGGREELARKEADEITVLERYLPPPVDPAELELAVDAAIQETAAASAKDMGKVMKVLTGKFAGAQVDGKALSELVRRKLTAS